MNYMIFTFLILVAIPSAIGGKLGLKKKGENEKEKENVKQGVRGVSGDVDCAMKAKQTDIDSNWDNLVVRYCPKKEKSRQETISGNYAILWGAGTNRLTIHSVETGNCNRHGVDWSEECS